MVKIEEIAHAVESYRPSLVSVAGKQHAAVAMVLHAVNDDTEVLIMERAQCEGDPWSGHLAFPGGRVDTRDVSPRSTVERETLEEVGIDLSAAQYLGRLDDLCGRPDSRLVISGFVYRAPSQVELKLNREVARAFWVSLEKVLDTKRHMTYPFVYEGFHVPMPAVDLLGAGQPVLWGLTYRFLDLMLEQTGRKIPTLAWK